MSLDEIKGKLVKNGDDTFKISDKTEFIGLYFSAHWCPPCRGFTPELVKYYNKEAGEKFEIVFISSDKDESAFDGYFATMPWAALKFDERGVKQELSETFGIRGIPTLVILDRTGKLVTTNGRGQVDSKLKGANPSATSWIPDE